MNGEKQERENTEPGGMKEPSVVIMDKTKPITSDLQREEERRVEKNDVIKKYCRAKRERDRKLAASQKSPFQGNNTAKQIIPTTKFGHGYNPFAPVDKKKAKVLFESLKKDP